MNKGRFKTFFVDTLYLFLLATCLWACRTKETAPAPNAVNIVNTCLPSTIKTVNSEGYLLTVAAGNYDNSGLLVSANLYDLSGYVKNSKVLIKYTNTYYADGSLSNTERFRDSISPVGSKSFLVADFKTDFTNGTGLVKRNSYNFVAQHYIPASRSYSQLEYNGNVPAKLWINTLNDRDNSLASKQLLAFTADATGNITKVDEDSVFNKPNTTPGWATIANATYNSSYKLPLNHVMRALTPDIIDSLPFQYLPETFNHFVKTGGSYTLDKATSFSTRVVSTDNSTGKPSSIEIKFLDNKVITYQLFYTFCN
jgi:hypothetical protein